MALLVALLVVTANEGQCGIKDSDGLARGGLCGAVNGQNDVVSNFLFFSPFKNWPRNDAILSFFSFFSKNCPTAKTGLVRLVWQFLGGSRWFPFDFFIRSF